MRGRLRGVVRLDSNGTLDEAIAMQDPAGYVRSERHHESPYESPYAEPYVERRLS